MKRTEWLIMAGLIMTVPGLGQNRYSSWDVFKYSGPGLDQCGWLDTRHSRDIETSTWSVGCETLDRDYADFNAYKKYVGELGVKHARLQSGWAKCEKKKGRYSFEWLDSCVYGLVEQSVEPWICLCYGNPVYKSELGLGAKVFTDDITMKAWLDYVEATVSRYKAVVKEWEVWNEPNLKNGGYVEYANLFMQTAAVIKRVQPESKVIGFAVAGIPLGFTEEVLKILQANDKLDLVDYLSYHPYTHNPDDSYGDVAKLKELVSSYNSDIELFQGENGCPSTLEWGHALNYYPWTEISQAKWLMRRMAGDRSRNIRTNVFTIIDLEYTNMLQSFGLIRSNLLNEIIYKRPSFYGVQHMVNILDDHAMALGELDFTSGAYRDIAMVGFIRGNFPMALLWYKDRIPGDEMLWDLVDITIEGMNFQDPVYVEMISGKVYDIDPADWENEGGNVIFNKLPVWDSVMMLAERSAL